MWYSVDIHTDIFSRRSEEWPEAGRDQCLAHRYFIRSDTRAGLWLKDSNSAHGALSLNSIGFYSIHLHPLATCCIQGWKLSIRSISSVVHVDWHLPFTLIQFTVLNLRTLTILRHFHLWQSCATFQRDCKTVDCIWNIQCICRCMCPVCVGWMCWKVCASSMTSANLSLFVSILQAQCVHGTDYGSQRLDGVAVNDRLVLLYIITRETILMDDPKKTQKHMS